jgi:hypothetical protein
VKARLLVNRSVTWATWMRNSTLELQELNEAYFHPSLTGFDPKEIDDLLLASDDDQANIVPPVPDNPVSRAGHLWVCSKHRVLCGDATSSDAVAQLLGKRRPHLMVTDPPYGIELDSEWRDRADLNVCGPAEASYMKQRTKRHTETTISVDTRADWSEAFELVPSLQIAYVWHASKFTREVLNGLLRIAFEHHQQIIWDKKRTVLTRTLYWFQHEPCWFVRKKNAAWYGKAGENSTIWASPSPKFIMGGSDEDKFDHPTQKPVDLMRRPILNAAGSSRTWNPDSAPDIQAFRISSSPRGMVGGITDNRGDTTDRDLRVIKHGGFERFLLETLCALAAGICSLLTRARRTAGLRRVPQALSGHVDARRSIPQVEPENCDSLAGLYRSRVRNPEALHREAAIAL